MHTGYHRDLRSYCISLVWCWGTDDNRLHIRITNHVFISASTYTFVHWYVHRVFKPWKSFEYRGTGKKKKAAPAATSFAVTQGCFAFIEFFNFSNFARTITSYAKSRIGWYNVSNLTKPTKSYSVYSLVLKIDVRIDGVWNSKCQNEEQNIAETTSSKFFTFTHGQILVSVPMFKIKFMKLLFCVLQHCWTAQGLSSRV